MQHPFETRFEIVRRVKAGTPIHRPWRELGMKVGQRRGTPRRYVL